MERIDQIINKAWITYNSVIVNFISGQSKIGFFEHDHNFDRLKKKVN